jgi:hypothetical protein
MVQLYLLDHTLSPHTLSLVSHYSDTHIWILFTSCFIYISNTKKCTSSVCRVTQCRTDQRKFEGFRVHDHTYGLVLNLVPGMLSGTELELTCTSRVVVWWIHHTTTHRVVWHPWWIPTGWRTPSVSPSVKLDSHGGHPVRHTEWRNLTRDSFVTRSHGGNGIKIMTLW